MIPALASESAAARKLAPFGTTTRRVCDPGSGDGPQPASVTSRPAHATEPATRRHALSSELAGAGAGTPFGAGITLPVVLQRMLQEHGGSDCIHVSPPAAGAATLLANRSEGSNSSEALVHEADGQSRSPGELLAHAP